MIPSTLQPVVNHLCQSTLFAAMVGLATLWLRKNSAQTRYWLWLAASVKFLIPLSILVIMGSHFGRHTVAAMEDSSVRALIEPVNQAFEMTIPRVSITPRHSRAGLIPPILGTVWAIGVVVILSSWWRRWREIRALLRT